MTRVGFLAIIFGALLAAALILHFRATNGSTSQTRPRAVSNESAGDPTTTESRPDSPNGAVEVILVENEPLPEVVLTNAAKVTNDVGFSPVEMRAPPAKRQRIQIPPNARWVPTNMPIRRTGPGVPIAFP